MPAPPSPSWACACLQRRPPADALTDLGDELVELAQVRSLHDLADELSGIAWALGRPLGGIFGRRYLPVPGDRRHRAKVEARMATHGCVRSPRHLLDGRCPAATNVDRGD